MELAIRPSSLVEASAISVAEASLRLKTAEAHYKELVERQPPVRKAWRRQAAEHVRDCSVDKQVALIGYEFVREAPPNYPAGHKITLPNMEGLKLSQGWTAEDLGERLDLPEATVYCIEDGMPVHVMVAARIAHALGVRLRDLVLTRGQGLAAYWSSAI